MEQEEASFFLVLAFKSASFLGRLVLAFITTSCSIFFRIPTSRFFLSCCCCTMRAFLGAITRPPFLGPRFRAEAAAAALLFAGFCAWNLRCPCVFPREAQAVFRWLTTGPFWVHVIGEEIGAQSLTARPKVTWS